MRKHVIDSSWCKRLDYHFQSRPSNLTWLKLSWARNKRLGVFKNPFEYFSTRNLQTLMFARKLYMILFTVQPPSLNAILQNYEDNTVFSDVLVSVQLITIGTKRVNVCNIYFLVLKQFVLFTKIKTSNSTIGCDDQIYSKSGAHVVKTEIKRNSMLVKTWWQEMRKYRASQTFG